MPTRKHENRERDDESEAATVLSAAEIELLDFLADQALARWFKARPANDTEER